MTKWSILTVVIVTAVMASASIRSETGVALSDGPAIVLFRACREAGNDPRDALEPLLSAQWKNVTSVEALRRVASERQNMLVRQKLGRASPSGPWDDNAVRRSYPSTMARSIEELVAHVQRSVDNELAPMPSRREFVLAPPNGRGLAAIFAYPESLTCEIVEHSVEDPHLETGAYSGNSRLPQDGLGQRAAPGIISSDNDYQVSVLKLTPRALRDDPRFPVEFDLSVWMSFLKETGEQRP